MDTFVADLALFMGGWPSEMVALTMFLTASAFILFLFNRFSVEGLYAYNIVAIIVANIQVLRMAKFDFSPEPIVLGTISLTTTFLVSDIITEHFGPEKARKGLGLSFVAQILMTIYMVFTLGFKPVINPTDAGQETTAFLAMKRLFTPSLRLLVASLMAYVISQFLDIWVFQKVRELTKGKLLWLRMNLSTLVAGLMDGLVFSVLAWVLLADDPVDWNTLIFSFVLGTYGFRVIVAMSTTPMIYLSYMMKPQELKKSPQH